MKKSILKYIVIFLIFTVALCALLPPLRSLVVMSIYSSKEKSKSVMENNGFKIDTPSSKGWYPFVITFNPVNFGKWSKTGADMSIMYNFAKFNIKTFSSDIFDPENSKNSSFYGAYALEQPEGYFGYENGEINIDEIVLTFKYDYTLLVLEDIGCEYPVFEVISFTTEENVTYLGSDGWTKIDATLKTNSMVHNYKENHSNYIQYGKPKYEIAKDFPVINMYGRLYVKAFDEYNSTIVFYVMSPSIETIEECDLELLQSSTIQSTD